MDRILLIVALVLFVLVGFGGNGHVALTAAFLVPAGLACWVGAHLA